jgi:hypothetical protein
MAWGAAFILIAILLFCLKAPVGFPIFFAILGFCCLFSYTTVITPAEAEILQQCRFLSKWSVFAKRRIPFSAVQSVFISRESDESERTYAHNVSLRLKEKSALLLKVFPASEKTGRTAREAEVFAIPIAETIGVAVDE